jgi:tetratricopeptide (TPR) repeat protein
VFAAPTAAQIYKYVDENGNVHYTDQPQSIPKGSQTQLKRPRDSKGSEHPQGVASQDPTAGYGPTDPRTPRALELAAERAAKAGDLDRAMDDYRAALGLWEGIQGPDGPALAECHYRLSQLWKQTGNVGEAAGHLKRAAEIRARTHGEGDPAARIYFRQYLSALRALGRHEEAAQAERNQLTRLDGPRPGADPADSEAKESEATDEEQGKEVPASAATSPDAERLPIDLDGLLEQIEETGLVR